MDPELAADTPPSPCCDRAYGAQRWWSSAACTWLAIAVTPSLTRDRDMLEVALEMELNESLLPDRSRLILARDVLRGVDVTTPDPLDTL